MNTKLIIFLKSLHGLICNIRDLLTGNGNLRSELTELLWKLHEEELSRLNFVRNEILLELKSINLVSDKITTKILNKEKYDLMSRQNSLVLNIGCGHHSVANMLNVDMRELPGVDVIADAADIQLPDKSVQGIFSSHILEHFPQELLKRAVIPNWLNLIRPGGFFRAIVPDAEGMIDAFAKGQFSFENLRTVTFGLQEYQGDIHYTMFSRDSLKSLLEEAGLRDVSYIATSRVNGLCLEMEIIGYKH